MTICNIYSQETCSLNGSDQWHREIADVEDKQLKEEIRSTQAARKQSSANEMCLPIQ